MSISSIPKTESITSPLSDSGRVKTESVTTVPGSPIVIAWSGSNAPYKSLMWLPVLSWDVPVGTNFNPYQIQYSAGNSSSYIKATKRLLMGSFNNATQVFTDGGSYVAPDFAGYLNIYFLADVGTSRTVTITYVNSLGVAGRTATYAMTSGSGGDKNGHMQRITLQAGDVGVRDITNITTDGTGTATFQIFGETDFIYDSADASGVVYTDTLPIAAFVIPYGFTISFQITSAATSAVDRTFNVTGVVNTV